MTKYWKKPVSQRGSQIITVCLTDDVYTELKNYLERRLVEANCYYSIAREQYCYYRNNDKYTDNTMHNLDICLSIVNKYKEALESFEEINCLNKDTESS